jgi:hypothetical protein
MTVFLSSQLPSEMLTPEKNKKIQNIQAQVGIYPERLNNHMPTPATTANTQAVHSPRRDISSGRNSRGLLSDMGIIIQQL